MHGGRAGLNPVKAGLGADPEPSGAVAERGPNDVVGKALGGGKGFPAVLAHPADDAVADEADPDGALPIHDQRGDVIARQAVALGDQPPVVSHPDAKSRSLGSEYVTMGVHGEGIVRRGV